MNKKILVVSVIVLALTVVLTACKGKDYKPTDEKPENTDKVVGTVPYTDEQGSEIDITVYEDETGEKYVTNIQGDKIPMTTDSDGFSDDVGSLITQTTAPSTTKAPSGGNGTTAPQNGSTTTTTTTNTTTTTSPSSTQENVTGGPPSIGSVTEQDTISWDEIKNG